MALLIGATDFVFRRPWWLLTALAAVPLVWLSWRNLAVMGTARQYLAAGLRTAVVVGLAMLLASPAMTTTNEQVTLIVIVDRSQSVPAPSKAEALAFLERALPRGQAKDRVSVIDVAESAYIVRLPSTDKSVTKRNVELTGEQTDLAGSVQMAMAIAPPETATRILLVSDGNQTEGDLREAARIAAANGIPVDVYPSRYRYEREVIFRRLAAPTQARAGQTVALRFLLTSTHAARGRLQLALNGEIVDLDPTSDQLTVPITLKPGTNVKTVSLPVGTRGSYEFEARFLPDDPAQDGLSKNNVASAMTFVSGPGHVLVLDSDGRSADAIVRAMGKVRIDARRRPASRLPNRLVDLVSTDAIVLADVDASELSFDQQRMLCRYVTDLGGGLVMLGGPHSFGAGGWIGSPVADILPVDVDPPQKKQMPKGALVMVMHACEMPRGNYWGKQVAVAAANALSRQDLVGVVDYAWNGGQSHWVHPLSVAGDKKAVAAAINGMAMGDMPDFGAPMQAAYNALVKAKAGQKHVIVISDGDPSPPSKQLLASYKQAGITCTGVAVFPHTQQDTRSLQWIAQQTGGRFHHVKNPSKLPQIFIKEAQVVRRALIVEEEFQPKVTFSVSEIVRGLGGQVPKLDGYVLTGARGGLNQLILTSHQGDPILAAGQFGLGRCIAFTSSADSRWAASWLAWGGFERFWEQAVRWVSKPSQRRDCEVFADVRGRKVSLTVEAAEVDGKPVGLSKMVGQVIAPDMKSQALPLRQVGPGQYRADFTALRAGSYLVNLRYRAREAPAGGGDDRGSVQVAVSVPYAPEFRALSDNTALLTEVASMTGGRVVNAAPDQADLFSRQGVKFPQTSKPLQRMWILIWLGVFLMDVAVRRIAIDFPAIGRRIRGVLRRKKAGQVSPQLGRLQSRRKQIQREMARKGDRAVTGKRFEAPDSATGELPSIGSSDAVARPKPPEAPEEQPEPPKREQPAHLQRLLRAKKRSQGGPDQGEDK